MTDIIHGRVVGVGSGPVAKSPPINRGLGSRLLREPLLHFMLAGGLLLLASRLYSSANDQHRIVVDPARVAEIENTYRLQYGSTPTAQVREDLVRQWVDGEALYREGVSRGVDRDDEIIRRRVIQKMQFLTQDLAAPSEPTPSALNAYYQAHLERYRPAERVTFSHIFFSPDQRGDLAARDAAEATLSQLSPTVTRAPELGDRFSDRYDYAGISLSDATRLFGRTPMASDLFAAPVGRWSGPYRSGFGWHLIRVDGRETPGAPSFDAVADQVRSDFQADERARVDAKALSDLETSYRVVREDRSGPQ